MSGKQIVSVVLTVLIIQSCLLVMAAAYPKHDKRPGKEISYEREPEEERDPEYSHLTEEDYISIKPCIKDERKMELCLRCAKATKAHNVYPMCCSNEDGVQNWCQEFVYYGIQ